MKKMSIITRAYKDFFYNNENPEIKYTIKGKLYFENISIYFSKFHQFPYTEKILLNKFIKGPVLDIGAGAGRVTLYLQNKGIPSIALDKENELVEIGKKRGVLNYCNCNFFKFTPSKQFNTVLLLGNTLGAFHNDNSLDNLFKKTNSLLTTGGNQLISFTDLTYLNINHSETIEIKTEYKGKKEILKWKFYSFKEVIEISKKNNFELVAKYNHNFLNGLVLRKIP